MHTEALMVKLTGKTFWAVDLHRDVNASNVVAAGRLRNEWQR